MIVEWRVVVLPEAVDDVGVVHLVRDEELDGDGDVVGRSEVERLRPSFGEVP